jgi:hypothetical protein
MILSPWISYKIRRGDEGLGMEDRNGGKTLCVEMFSVATGGGRDIQQLMAVESVR